jgi:hypothetical protein
MTMSLSGKVLLERLERRCALGIRFRDLATQEMVMDGLDVSGYPVGAPRSAASAQVNRSGVWAFPGLSGLRGYEFGTEEVADWKSTPGLRRFQVEVRDLFCRFLPCSFEAEVPSTGLFKFAAQTSPPGFGPDVPLFSAPSRIVPPGYAVVRMELAAGDASQPAAWALVKATTSVRGKNVQALGLADDRGAAAIILPWPEPASLALTSPPGSLNVAAQGWTFEFSAWHEFGAPPTDMANLDSVTARFGRAANPLWVRLSPPEAFKSATLIFRQELIVPEHNSELDTRNLIITAA